MLNTKYHTSGTLENINYNIEVILMIKGCLLVCMIIQVIFVAPFALFMFIGGPDPGSGVAHVGVAIGTVMSVISLSIAAIATMILFQKKPNEKKDIQSNTKK